MGSHCFQMSMSMMDSLLSLTFIFVLFTVLQQSQCVTYFTTRNYHLEHRELRGSVACFKTLTSVFLEHLKTVVHPSCIDEGNDEFRRKVVAITSTFSSIIKYGRNHDRFVQEMQKAEEIATKAIAKIQQCLTDNCSDEKQDQIKYSIHVFRVNNVRCGDSSYLSRTLTALEHTCAKQEKENDSNETKSDGVDGVAE